MTKIEWSNAKRKLSDLIPWPRNPRKIGDEQRKRLNTSLLEFAQVETIAIGPGNEVYNGHQRLTAWAEEYGDLTVDVRVANRALTEKEREKLTVFLHKGAAGEWDFEKLAEFDVADLTEWGFDAGELANCGFDAVEPGEVEDVEPQIDKAAELREKWSVETGQLWQLGNHRLLCGDCTKAEDVARVTDGEKADLCLTDPPYGISDTVSNKNKYDEYDDSRENLKKIISLFLPIAQKTAPIVVLTPGNGNLYLYPKTTWNMAWFTPAGVGRGPWGFCCWQPILCYGKDPMLSKGKGCYPDAIVHTETAEKLGHPCSKPIKLWEWLMNRTSVKGETIYDSFSGSGTTIIAAEQLGRRCYAIEISPAYCAVSLQRWADATGKTPILLNGQATD